MYYSKGAILRANIYSRLYCPSGLAQGDLAGAETKRKVVEERWLQDFGKYFAGHGLVQEDKADLLPAYEAALFKHDGRADALERLVEDSLVREQIAANWRGWRELT